MILSDIDILNELEKGDLAITLEDIDTQVQPASVDVRLSTEFTVFRSSQIPCIHPSNEDEINQYVEDISIDKDDELIVHPGDFILGATIEKVEIPDYLTASLEGRSSLGRLAIICHATAGWIDPGFVGQVTLEISNLGPAPVALSPGMRIGQLVFQQLKSPAEKPYGEPRNSKYQNQSTPVPSRIGDDEEFQ